MAAPLAGSGKLTESQTGAATQELRRQLADVETRFEGAARGTALEGVARVPDVAQVWAGLSLDRRRAVVDAVAVVTVLPRTARGRLPGGLYFDPNTVTVEWRGTTAARASSQPP